MKNPAFKEQNGIVTYDQYIYVPPNKKLWEELIVAYYSSVITGHSGIMGTILKIVYKF